MSEDAVGSGEQPFVVYANNLSINISVYDFALSFGISDDHGVATQVVVRMSPQHAKSVLMLLDRFVGVYEDQVARIVLPEGLGRQLRGQEEEESGDDEKAN